MGLKINNIYMNTIRTHVVFSPHLINQIDAFVGKRGRSQFLTHAAENELMRLRQLKALNEVMPWKVEDHPELKLGAAKYIKKLRGEYELRFKKITNR